MNRDRRINIFKLLRREGKLTKVLLYPAQEIEVDPYYHKKELTYQQPITIDALVRQLNPSELRWKYYGQIPLGSKQIICEKKYINTIKAADRIKIEDNYYKVRKDDSRGFSIIKRNDYIVIVVELKTINA